MERVETYPLWTIAVGWSTSHTARMSPRSSFRSFGLSRSFVASMAVAALLLVGCGDDGGDDAGDTASNDDSVVSITSSTPETDEAETDEAEAADDTEESTEENAEDTEENEEDTEEAASDRHFTVTVGSETYEFSAVTWCDNDDGAWDVTATGDGRKNDVNIQFNPDSPAESNTMTINLDNQNTTMASEPTTRWKATQVQGTTDGNSASGTATIEGEMGDAPAATEVEWSFACEPF